MASTSASGDITVASKVAFNQLCQLLERMHKANNNATRKTEFTKFVDKWKEIHLKIHKNKSTKDSFYPVFRLILPSLERERPSYGIKETALAKLYVEIFGLSKNSPDASRILNYKNPKSNNTGDFAAIAFTHILSKRCPASGSMTIQQINESLDLLAHCNTQGKKAALRKNFMDLVQNTSAMEQKWIARIILKDNKLKIGATALLNEFHPDSEDLYNISTSLREVCEKLRDKGIRLSDAEITLFQPFRPMLAEMTAITAVEKLMDHKVFRVEIKYDGERSQLHKDGSIYKYFSRSSREYSTVFGDNPYSGSLTPFIHDNFDSSVKSCILDGEMMGYDPDLKTFVQKGAQFDIKHITQDSDLQPCFVAYDVLMLNGENLSSKPLKERLEKLADLFTTIPGRIQFSESWSCTTNAGVVNHLNDAVDRREEGIIIKDLYALYSPNKRKGSGWIKIKPEYASGVIDDMDLVVVGGKFGDNKYANMITKFLLAVAVKRNDNKPPEKFKTFAFVGSGFTNRELYKVMEILKPNLELFSKKNPPSWLQVGKEKPEVIVKPENSVVLQIKATEIILSNAYATGCTLRFPRVIAHRDDKKFDSAMDDEQLKQLREMAQGKLTARHASLTSEEPAAKRKKITRKIEHSTINTKFQSANTKDVSKVSKLFDGKEICVLTGNSSNSKQDLEKLIVANGGSITQNPSKTTYCIVAKDTKNVRVKNAMRSGKYDIVNILWLVQCCETIHILPFSPAHILQITNETKTKLSVYFDRFGDDFTTPLTTETIKTIFENIEIKLEEKQTQQRLKINELIKRYEEFDFHSNPGTLFHGLNFYVPPDSSENNDVLSELKSLIVFNSGVLHEELQEDTTHVIVINQNDVNLNDLFANRRKRDKKFHIVTPEWLFDCFENDEVLQERSYAVTLQTTRRNK